MKILTFKLHNLSKLEPRSGFHDSGNRKLLQNPALGWASCVWGGGMTGTGDTEIGGWKPNGLLNTEKQVGMITLMFT